MCSVIYSEFTLLIISIYIHTHSHTHAHTYTHAVTEYKHNQLRKLNRTKILIMILLESVLTSLAVLTKHPRLDVLNNRNLFSYSSGGSKYRTKVLTGLKMVALSLHPHMVTALCVLT